VTPEEVADAYADALGERFVGFFTYGAAMFPPSPVLDIDFHAIVDRPLNDEERKRVRALRDEHLDGYVVTIDALSLPEPPAHQVHEGVVDEAWALHRAHVLAGRYRCIVGPDPATIVPAPTWDELDAGLRHELEWLTGHLDDAPEYCVLNLCRIACSYANHDVVFSKLDGALWALAALPDEHHAIVRAALDGYRTNTFGNVQARVFYEAMRPRIEAL
jgi:Domain of unknown function (DUF4111)